MPHVLCLPALPLALGHLPRPQVRSQFIFCHLFLPGWVNNNAPRRIMSGFKIAKYGAHPRRAATGLAEAVASGQRGALFAVFAVRPQRIFVSRIDEYGYW